MLSTLEILALAASHLDNGAVMASSARSALEDARACLSCPENEAYAAPRALDSLAYSVGIFHADYQRAARAVVELGDSGRAWTILAAEGV